MIGPGWAKELVLAGEFINAEKAAQLGLVTRVVPKDKQEEARSLAEKLVAKAPMAMGLAKAIMNTCENIDMASGRILERIGQSVLITSQDHKEGVRLSAKNGRLNTKVVEKVIKHVRGRGENVGDGVW